LSLQHFAYRERHCFSESQATPARIEATYDPALGIPLNYHAEKLELPDNDEGFRISSFEVLN
jgi:hypothetical protein